MSVNKADFPRFHILFDDLWLRLLSKALAIRTLKIAKLLYHNGRVSRAKRSSILRHSCDLGGASTSRLAHRYEQ